MTTRAAIGGCILALTLVSPGGAVEVKSSGGYARGDLLVETSWLDEKMIRPEIIIVDLRARETYDQNHIPNSIWLDEEKIVDRSGQPPHVAGESEFKALMESVGVGDDAHVIVVDEAGGKAAARLWWAFAYYGFDRVSILNGGYAKWEGEGRAITVEYPFVRKAAFTPRVRPSRVAMADQVKTWSSKPGGVILDARPRQEFSGERSRSRRAGHILGARSIPIEEDLAEREGFLAFKPASELLEIYRKAGVTGTSPVVAYCQDGKRHPHLLFTMALIGLTPDGTSYIGGWSEWGNSADLPIEGPEKKAPPPSKARTKAGGPAKAKGGT